LLSPEGYWLEGDPCRRRVLQQRTTLDHGISRESWNPRSIEVDPRDKSNNHMCHDPRWFFAGAPSAYMDHLLASTLHLTDKSKGSSWNAPSLLMDLLLKSIGVLIGLLVIGTLV
jgi:hypothetical protein